MSTGRLFYITGIPGTGVEAALRRYICRQKSATPQLIKLETQLKQKAQQDLDVRLPEILLRPKPELAELWTTAFLDSLNKAQRHMDSGSDVFLTFHACWYHLRNREFISSIDFQALQKVKPALVITLIDDIYDILNRLSAPHELFDADLSDDSFLDYILKLSLILTWRAFEILLSDRLAYCTDAEHYLFATKHSYQTFDQLLNKSQELPSSYLSHHISSPRLMFGSDADAAGRRLMATIQELAGLLRQRVLLFEPTTIDELRIKRIRHGKDEFLLPLLTERWTSSEQSDDLLYEAPRQVNIVPFGQEAHTLALDYLRAPSNAANRRKLRSLSPLLTQLAAEIRKQINARDHKLVEQSGGIVAYRPYFMGQLAQGMQEELEHHSRLCDTGENKRQAFVLHPEEDEMNRKVKVTTEHLTELRNDGTIEGSEEGWKRLLGDLSGIRGTTDEIWKNIETSLRHHNLHIRTPAASSTLGREPASVRQEQLQQLRKELSDKISDCYLGRLKQTTVWQDSAKPAVFASRILHSLELM